MINLVKQKEKLRKKLENLSAKVDEVLKEIDIIDSKLIDKDLLEIQEGDLVYTIDLGTHFVIKSENFSNSISQLNTSLVGLLNKDPKKVSYQVEHYKKIRSLNNRIETLNASDITRFNDGSPKYFLNYNVAFARLTVEEAADTESWSHFHIPIHSKESADIILSEFSGDILFLLKLQA